MTQKRFESHKKNDFFQAEFEVHGDSLKDNNNALEVAKDWSIDKPDMNEWQSKEY